MERRTQHALHAAAAAASRARERAAVPADGVTRDAVLGGRVRFEQPARGYRTNVDSILLAAFARRPSPAALAVDLGAGVGLVSLLLHHFRAARRFALIEREPWLVELARRNLSAAGAPGRAWSADLAEARALPAELCEAADLVVSNPPFFDEGRHRAPADAARGRARLGSLGPFLRAAARVARGSRARIALVYPPRALDELFELAAANGLVAKRMRLVHPFLGRPARLALLELRRARPGGLVIEPPLVEWERPSVPTRELAELSGETTVGRG